MRFRLITTLSISLFFIGFSTSNAQDHVVYQAMPGDGVFAILRKFGLEKANCNLQYFFKINNIQDDKSLNVNTSYKLPILIYKYNGQSIRSTISNFSIELAKAIEDYNDQLVVNGLKSKSYKDNNELWVPHSYLNCQAASITKPPLKDGKYPIFGSQYSEVQPVDNVLSDYVIYIVSGHGGPDPGAMAVIDGHTVSEDEYAYDISLRLARNLLMHGAITYMITRDPNDGIRDEKYLECDHDEQCLDNQTIPLNQIQRLKQRASAINNLYYKYKKQNKKQLVITIHIDSREEDKRVDMFFYHHPKSQTSKEICQLLFNTIKEKYNYYNPWRGYNGEVIARDLYMLRETMPTSIYLELGNLKNPKDQDRFTLPSNRQAVADWLTDGLVKLP